MVCVVEVRVVCVRADTERRKVRLRTPPTRSHHVPLVQPVSTGTISDIQTVPKNQSLLHVEIMSRVNSKGNKSISEQMKCQNGSDQVTKYSFITCS